MKLLIDLGNSRLKWAVYHKQQRIEEGTLRHNEIALLGQVLKRYPIDQAWGACVAALHLRDAVENQMSVPLTWCHSETETLGIVNHYRRPSEHGVDRWLAVIGASGLFPQQDLIVVSAGTALTVEALTHDSHYLGGIILPGHRLMHDSLAKGTAQLNRPEGQFQDFPQGTEDAITSGILDAQLGAIERFRFRLSQNTQQAPARVILAGGDAKKFLPHLTQPTQIVDNLVIKGLLRVATYS